MQSNGVIVNDKGQNGTGKLPSATHVKSSFTFPLIDETLIGNKGCINKENVLRRGDQLWINENSIVYPAAYWKAGAMLKCERLSGGRGTNSFAIDAYRAIITPFIVKYRRYPNWWLRLKGYIGPIDLTMKTLANDNWWESSMVEDLVNNLTAASYKRHLPTWFEHVRNYAIERIHANVLRYEQALELFTQVYGIKSLVSVGDALTEVMTQDGSRYKEQFSPEMVAQIISEFSNGPKEVYDILQKSLHLKRAEIGFGHHAVKANATNDKDGE